jgi:coniferyl-aldehyde dehydrogenase
MERNYLTPSVTAFKFDSVKWVPLRKDALVSTTNKIVKTVDADRALDGTLAHQRAAFLRDGAPSLAERRRDLTKLKEALLARQEEFIAALDVDFGHRARQETLMLDIGSTVGAINYLHGNLRRFMRPERRHVAAIFKPGSAKVVYQPLGVVGIVSPWNFPVSLAVTPLATALAAGNRVMLKPSEMTPATTGLLASMLTEIFDAERSGRLRRRQSRQRVFSLPSTTSCLPVARQSAAPSCARRPRIWCR